MILIVDDEQMVATSVAENIRQSISGVDVKTCSDGFAAQQILSQGAVTLLITDYRMPGLSGLQLITWCKELFPRLPVILMTGYGRPDLKVHALRLGAAYLEKPFQMKPFIELIRSLIPNSAPSSGDSFGADVIHHADLADLLQILGMGNLNRTLIVLHEQKMGTVNIKCGQVAHAETGNAVGLDALARMLVWKNADIEVHEGYLTHQHTIHTASTQQALIEAMRLANEYNPLLLTNASDRPAPSSLSLHSVLDEIGVTEESFAYPASNHVPPNSIKASSQFDAALESPQKTKTPPPNAQARLERAISILQDLLVELPQIESAGLILLRPDGSMGVEALQNPNHQYPDQLLLPPLLKGFHQMLEQLKLGSLDYASLSADNGILLMLPIVNSDYFLALRLPPGECMNPLLVVLRAWVQRIATMLEVVNRQFDPLPPLPQILDSGDPQ